LHATGKLSLAEIAALAQIAHCPRHLQAVILGDGFLRFDGELGYEPLGLLYFERFVAASAKRVRSAKLNQCAAFTPKNLARLYSS
jgi:hypothetical protein